MASTPKMDMNGLANAIKIEAPKQGDTQLKVTLPTSDEYDVTYNGTDYEQVIGAQAEDRTIPPSINRSSIRRSRSLLR